MPPAFTKCVNHGGKVRTVSINGKKYIHVCFADGKSYSGEVKTKKG